MHANVTDWLEGGTDVLRCLSMWKEHKQKKEREREREERKYCNEERELLNATI